MISIPNIPSIKSRIIFLEAKVQELQKEMMKQTDGVKMEEKSLELLEARGELHDLTYLVQQAEGKHDNK